METLTDDHLSREIAAVRESGLLGRSDMIRGLFDYLAGCSLADRSPKEIEVAAAVLGRGPDFDPGRDAVVRVYVHKLRKRLESIYAGPRSEVRPTLVIPLGDYRIVLSPDAPAAAEAERSPSRVRASEGRRWPTLLSCALGLVVASSAITWFVQRAAQPPAVKNVERLRSGPVWSPILANRFPILIAIGDYYIFGESDDGMQTDRLVRQYTINSAEDLDEFLMRNPEKKDHYLDLGLRYLPVGAASALRDVLPLVEPSSPKKSLRIILASAITPEMLKANNIVYIGYFSGLGALRDRVFAASRFSIGQTYDDLHDSRTHRDYISEGGGPENGSEIYRDYGYFSTFNGPEGARIVTVIGTRDVGLMQIAETVTRSAGLAAAVRRAGEADAFEALYRVEGMNRQNMGGSLLEASPLNPERIWNGEPPAKSFPAG